MFLKVFFFFFSAVNYYQDNVFGFLWHHLEHKILTSGTSNWCIQYLFLHCFNQLLQKVHSHVCLIQLNLNLCNTFWVIMVKCLLLQSTVCENIVHTFTLAFYFSFYHLRSLSWWPHFDWHLRNTKHAPCFCWGGWGQCGSLLNVLLPNLQHSALALSGGLIFTMFVFFNQIWHSYDLFKNVPYV